MSDDETRANDSATPETPAASPAPCEIPSSFRPEIREALEPTCCGSGCEDCPF